MSIRLTVTDRATGEILNVPVPACTEHTKNGVRKIKTADTSDVMAILKARSKLGHHTGCLA